MNKLNFVEIDMTTIFVVVFSAIILLLQFLLCFKGKYLFFKLAPIALLSTSTIIFSILSACIGGWDGMGLIFLGLLSFYFIFVCAIGWGIWFIIRKRNQ